MNSRPTSWQIIAGNLPEHARNPIHTDDGAQAAGFPRALVAGVTTYAYLTHPLIVAWGRDWLQDAPSLTAIFYGARPLQMATR
ncbi:MAG: hypothetical protein NTW34_00525 [Actinobacteria bacterium]|nr:hypothetical protein [Actinomycetota bacterium]